ncbi:MAG: nicotinate-nucleotide--dimethylbenzimidazole phosphoribosyltransferase [Clostridiales bacterium]|nr:nicotinate-nucleotide--dimethylbenzimidazole phosphoribosyltransferase [Clostridiales bacterium]
MELKQALESIKGLNAEAMSAAQEKLDSLSKPLGSLGRLEEMVVRVAGITGDTSPKIDKKALVIMCADNGVFDEGVSSCPRSVTAAVTRNFIRGITGVCVFARQTGASLVIVDIGVDDDIDEKGIINRKIRKGTWNIAKGPAMTREEAVRAIETGIDIVGDLKARGINLLGTGEMGIANTTTSSAVTAVLAGRQPEEVVGRGSGLSSEAFANKIEVVKRAIEINNPDPNDAIDVLSKVGGFDIAGLAGCFLGAAVHRVPILIDGFISAAAALIAVRIMPEVKQFIFPSHGSAEPGSRHALEALGMQPYLNLDMRLGEGTGAAMGFMVFDSAFAAYEGMGTFNDAEIEQYIPLI